MNLRTWGIAAVALAGVLTSAPNSLFRSNEKAAYADERTVSFVRPGLQIQITGVETAADGTVRAAFRITDPRGLALDRAGVVTPGTVNTSFVLARIPADDKFYKAYTTRTQTSPITGQSATQAAADTGGRYEEVAVGEYVYQFGAKLPADADRSATHSILVYASRNLSEFDLGTNYFDTVFTWVPSGAPVTKTRDIVQTATCNKCHTDLGFHGGARKSVAGCILCHTPQTTDPDTGNTVDFTTMIHKIHMGAELPSNQAGGKYCIVGNAQSEHCYDKVEFVANPRQCSVCHDTKTSPAHLQNPTRQACGSCHDNVNFATGENHATGLPQLDDRRCATCHTPEGDLEFDASITGAHIVPERSPSLPGIRFEIVSIDDGAAGGRPRVTFAIKDKAGNVVKPAEMTSLNLVLGGPTSDYANYWSESARAAADVGGGQYAYTFNARIPEDARGSFTVGIEGYRNTTLLPGTTRERVVRDAGLNVTKSFAVSGGPVMERRRVVSTAKCNACHEALSLHGGNRNQVEQCVICHNPTMTDAARRPADRMPAESIHFATMIHRIHGGNRQTREFTIFGFGSAEHNYNNAGFPGILKDCAMCHVDNSHRLPVAEGTASIQDPRGYNPNPGPEGAACTGCHATKAAAAHAAINTNAIAESCSACHGANSQFSVDRSHAR